VKARVLSSAGEGALTAIAAAAFSHPDGQVQSQVRDRLDEWIDECRPMHQAEHVRNVLQDFSGTAIEPFVLDDTGLELATRFVRIAFSKAGRQTRFRVVSEDTIGTRGGFILTNNLNGYLVERFPKGKRRRTPTSTWHVAPAILDDFIGLGASTTSGVGELSAGTDRIEARVRMVTGLKSLVNADPENVDELLKDARLSGTGRELSNFGIVLSMDGDSMVVTANTPEAILRLTAILDAQETIEIPMKGERNAIGCLSLTIREDGPETLRVIIGYSYGPETPQVRDFMSIPLDGPQLPDPLRRQLTDWCLGPATWVRARQKTGPQ
jgi:hypothetical protein